MDIHNDLLMVLCLYSLAPHISMPLPSTPAIPDTDLKVTGTVCARRVASGPGTCQLVSVRIWNTKTFHDVCSILSESHLHPPPSVAIDCGSAPPVPHAEVSTNGTRFYDVATYSCTTGYRLRAASKLVCQHTGIWTGSLPSCTGKNLSSHNMYVYV